MRVYLFHRSIVFASLAFFFFFLSRNASISDLEKKKIMNTNNDIESDEHHDDAMMTMDEEDDDDGGGEEEGDEDENNRWALCIEHGGGEQGKEEEEEKRKDPPELIPLNATTDEGRAALHARRKMKTMRYDAVKKNGFPAVQSVSVGTQTDGDEEMFDDNDAEQQNQRRVSSLGLNDTNAESTPTKKIVLYDDDSSEEDGEVQAAAVKKKTKTKTKKKDSSLETADTTLRKKRGHCGFGVPGFAERQPLQMEDDEEEEEEKGELDDDMEEDTDFVAAAKRNRELNALIDYNNGGKKTSKSAHRNRRDVFTPFASNPNNKILLKRIMIKAGNNARFFLSKVSKPFRKVTLREFGAMSSSDLEQGRVKAVKISELETPAQFALCVEHGLQLNDLVFAALADGGRLQLLKYLHEEILPGKIYHCSLAVEYAAQNNHIETLKYLIECHDAPLCKDACWRAAWKGSADCLRYLILERKCPFDRNECHDIAYQYGHFDLARWIKEH